MPLEIMDYTKFDMHVLANVGIEIKTKDVFDTMIARWITDENKEKGLKGMTSEIYGVAQTKFDECLKTVTREQKIEYGLKPANKAQFVLVKIDVGAPYAIADSYWTWRHYCDWQTDELVTEEMETIFYKVQMPFLITLYNMERRGVRVDKEMLKEMEKKAKKDLDELIYEIVEIAGVEFNPASSQQLGELLFGYKKVNKAGEFVGNVDILDKSFNFPVQATTATGAPSTGEKILKSLSRVVYKKDKRKQEGVKLLRKILVYKRLNKLNSAFIKGLLKEIYQDGKIHPTFNAVGTSSGRISCSSPNLQQLPRPIELITKEQWENSEEFKINQIPYEEKFEEELFWKFYEIRRAFISDDVENEEIIALD